MTASEAPDEATQQLRDEIERTREDLGATVQELAAKVDVKSRAQAKAAELGGQVTWQAKSVMAQARKLATRTGQQAAQAGKQAGSRAGSASGAIAATTAGARQKALAAGKAVPAPVRQSAAKGTVTARKYRGPLSAGAGATGLLVAIAIIIWLRRKR